MKRLLCLLIVVAVSVVGPAVSARPYPRDSVGTVVHEEKSPKTCKIKPGDTLQKIADRHDTKIKTLVWRNRIPSEDFIIAGNTLKLRGHRRSWRQPAPVVQVSTATSTETQAPSSVPTSTPAPVSTSGVNWDAIAQCESGGDWTIDSTYDGGLQFHPDTWARAGGTQYCAFAYQCSREQQIAVAERWVEMTGCVQCSSGWPVCGAHG